MHKFAALLGIVTIFVGAGYYVSTSRELMLKDQTAPTFQIPTAEEPKKEVDIPIYNEAKRLVTEDYSLEVVSEAPIEFYIIDPAGRVSGRSSSESNEPIPSALYSKQIFEKTQQDAFFLSIPKLFKRIFSF